MATLDERAMSHSESRVEEKARSKRAHFFSRSVSRSSFSWSFVRNALQPTTRGSSSSSSSEESGGRCSDSNSVARSSVSSAWEASEASSLSGSPRSKRSRKPAVVEKIPYGKSSEFLTVHVGPRIEQSVKYVISRRVLAHPLFQVLLKCSEDEFGEDYSVDNDGVAIVCDPALFLHVVEAIDDSLWYAEQSAEDVGSAQG